MSDILDAQRRKRRPQKLTKNRDASLLNEEERDKISEPHIEIPLEPQKESETSSGNTVDELKAELAGLPEVAKRRIVRLEEGLDRRLADYLASNKNMTLDVLLEALFTELESNERLQKQVNKNCSKRYWERKRAGQIKRLLTQLE